MAKLGRLSTRGIVDYQHPKHFVRERVGWPGVPWLRVRSRLKVGVSDQPLALIERLALAAWPPPYRLLYVLVEGFVREPGRYEFRASLDAAELSRFLDRHRTFLETDSRHALWVEPVSGGGGRLVHDRHDLLFVYGRVRRIEPLLLTLGFVPGPVRVPDVHAHRYPGSDEDEATLLASSFWHHSPLHDIDCL